MATLSIIVISTPYGIHNRTIITNQDTRINAKLECTQLFANRIPDGIVTGPIPMGSIRVVSVNSVLPVNIFEKIRCNIKAKNTIPTYLFTINPSIKSALSV